MLLLRNLQIFKIDVKSKKIKMLLLVFLFIFAFSIFLKSNNHVVKSNNTFS